MEPRLGHRPLAMAGGEMDATRGPPERLLQTQAALGLRAGAEVAAVSGEQVERHEGGRRLGGELLHPPRRRVQSQLQGVEVEPTLGGDHDLAVDHAPSWQAGAKARFQLRKVPVERLQLTALDVEPVAVAEHDGPEAVPLGLEQPAVARGQVRRELREHRLDWRFDREPRGRVFSSHQGAPARRAAIRRSADVQPASKGCPGWSRSMISGAWSEGMGLPLRASRSISAHTVRPATGRVTSRWAMRMPMVLWKLPAR